MGNGGADGGMRKDASPDKPPATLQRRFLRLFRFGSLILSIPKKDEVAVDCGVVAGTVLEEV